MSGRGERRKSRLQRSLNVLQDSIEVLVLIFLVMLVDLEPGRREWNLSLQRCLRFFTFGEAQRERAKARVIVGGSPLRYNVDCQESGPRCWIGGGGL